MEFNGCKLEFRLIPQSPMIHFQGNENGATLRASEMKPKLDRFINKRLNRDHKSSGNKNLNNNHEALDYKIRITVDKCYRRIEEIGKGDDYSVFWGNSSKGPKKAGIISCPTITIICFKKDLQDKIVKYIDEFFWVTNFGTMQSKGFGGFLPEGNIPDERKIIKAFKDNGAKAVYKMNFDGPPIKCTESWADDSVCKTMFNDIKRFYSVMKSGQNLNCNEEDEAQRKGYVRSYLYEFMHNKYHIDNEKAWMKEKKISPNLITNPERKSYIYQTNPNPKYVRAFLGKPDRIMYKKKSENDNEGSFEFIFIKSCSPKIKRIPSIIFFKIIGSCVYIAVEKVPKDLYNQKFRFENKIKVNNKFQTNGDELYTPSHEDFPDSNGEFPVERFLDDYVEFYNGECRNKLKDMDEYKMVVKCQ